ncbi:MAG: cobalamin-dependent protein [Candidatus Izemoplasmatales bacterium]|jgi:methanogenic corrinoid protein MtbC1|nr:cobalamin-dependent protein [Candidatus Izemoplasmatales bacterium]
MNSDIYLQFVKLLDQELKDEAIEYALSLLETKAVTLKELYLQLLTPSLTNFVCNIDDEEICIWKEHTRTSIVRTILEASYPYVIKEKVLAKQNHKKVMVVCPSEEYHEIGAIIATNLFSLSGFNSLYIGANTPKSDIISAIRALSPDYIAFSVTNYYNIVVMKKITSEIKEKFPKIKIIVGGQAFLQHGALAQINYDYYLDNMENIIILEGGASL